MRKQQTQLFTRLMYTLMDVYVHFNCFIDALWSGMSQQLNILDTLRLFHHLTLSRLHASIMTYYLNIIQSFWSVPAGYEEVDRELKPIRIND